MQILPWQSPLVQYLTSYYIDRTTTRFKTAACDYYWTDSCHRIGCEVSGHEWETSHRWCPVASTTSTLEVAPLEVGPSFF